MLAQQCGVQNTREYPASLIIRKHSTLSTTLTHPSSNRGKK